MLRDQFVVGWKNNWREDYVGSSRGYTKSQKAVGTTNGAGGRNMQMFVLAADGTVMHCLPGFWHPEDLAVELAFGQAVHRVWTDKRSRSAKKKMYARLHSMAIRRQSEAMQSRSGWQGFDAKNEKHRLASLKSGRRDTFYYDEKGEPAGLKPLSVVVHERMAAQPFKSIHRFDTERLVDYGLTYYDNNKGVDGPGMKFGGTMGSLASQKRMLERKARRDKKSGKLAADGKKAKAEPNATQPMPGKT